jgi:hypothetical protein
MAATKRFTRAEADPIMSNTTLVILAHPNPGESRVNAAWRARLAEAAIPVTIRDIYQLYPDWNIDYVAHIGGLVPAKLAESSRPEAARASTSFTP